MFDCSINILEKRDQEQAATDSELELKSSRKTLKKNSKMRICPSDCVNGLNNPLRNTLRSTNLLLRL